MRATLLCPQPQVETCWGRMRWDTGVEKCFTSLLTSSLPLASGAFSVLRALCNVSSWRISRLLERKTKGLTESDQNSQRQTAAYRIQEHPTTPIQPFHLLYQTGQQHQRSNSSHVQPDVVFTWMNLASMLNYTNDCV